MFHNDVEYWRYLQSLAPSHRDLPAPRVCRLLLRLFERWREKPRWLAESQVGHLFRNQPEKAHLANLPVAIRKAMAIGRMLEIITDPTVAPAAGSAEVLADEIVLGTLPPFSVGQGKEFVRYLREDEELAAVLNYLNELSPMGHIVPDQQIVVDRGLLEIIEQCRSRQASATADQRAFYESVIVSLEAVIDYAGRFAAMADKLAASLAENDPNRITLRESAERLRHSPANPARTFHEAVQAIFIMHCALHWTVEVVPLGRLDQILYPKYQADAKAGMLTRSQAQEILDCLWIKFDETAILDYRHAEDRFTACDGTLTGGTGAAFFDQGGLLNQWMQQVTIGGVAADEAAEQTDATNEVTWLCLESARRLPLNSPTLDLRVHKGTPRELLEAAAETLLSGGAHPVLVNDDRIVPSLRDKTGGNVSLKSARNYACDGCFETMFAGETEFSFGFVPALDALEKALNRGAGFGAAGAVHLRGSKDSWRTPAAADIRSFDEFWDVLRRHILLGCHRYLNNLLALYGNKTAVAPSPLLSALIGGCVDSGRDLTAGGARYHLFSPLMTGISTAADSLFVIRELVFNQHKFSLEELVSCLARNWGRNPIAPGRFVSPARMDEIRRLCMEQPKFGQGSAGVDSLAWKLIETFVGCIEEARRDPVHAAGFERLKQFDIPGRPFQLLLAPGVGTFEQYVFGGSFAGASPDGRPAFAPIASDLSPAPLHPDEEPWPVPGGTKSHKREIPLTGGLRSYRHDSMNLLGDGAPADYNIREDFPSTELADVLERFARGEGGSVCTFTVANPETLAKARESREEYNLVRVRMGGWTEFYIALFPDHKEQHRRRPLFVAKEAKA